MPRVYTDDELNQLDAPAAPKPTKRIYTSAELDQLGPGPSSAPSKPTVAGDIPAIAASAVMGFVPGLREAIEYAPYGGLRRSNLDLIPPTGPRQAVAMGANTAIDIANAALSGDVGPMAVTAKRIAPSEPPQLDRPYPTLQLPLLEPRTNAGKGLALAAELGTSLLSGHAWASLKKRGTALENAIKRLHEKRAELDAIDAATKGSLAEFDATRRAAEETIRSRVRGAQAEIDRAIVEFDTNFFGRARDMIRNTRTKAQAWLQGQYKNNWNPRFEEAAVLETPLTPAEQRTLGSGLSALVPEAKVNLTPMEAKLRKLVKALNESSSPAGVDRLFAEVRKPFTGNLGPDDALAGKAKDLIVNYLAERAAETGTKSPFLQLRDDYRKFARMRDDTAGRIDLYGNPYDTKASVDSVTKFITAASDPDPRRAQNVADAADFLERYREIDPEFADAVSNVTRERRGLQMSRRQVAALGEDELRQAAADFTEAKRRMLETGEQTLERLKRGIVEAKTDLEQARARNRLNFWLQKHVLRGVGKVVALGGAGFAAGAGVRTAGRIMSGLEPPPLARE